MIRRRRFTATRLILVPICRRHWPWRWIPIPRDTGETFDAVDTDPAPQQQERSAFAVLSGRSSRARTGHGAEVKGSGRRGSCRALARRTGKKPAEDTEGGGRRGRGQRGQRGRGHTGRGRSGARVVQRRLTAVGACRGRAKRISSRRAAKAHRRKSETGLNSKTGITISIDAMGGRSRAGGGARRRRDRVGAPSRYAVRAVRPGRGGGTGFWRCTRR